MSFLEVNGKSLNQKYSNASLHTCKYSSTHIMTTLCLGKKMIKTSVKKAMCYNALISSKPEFPQEIENHSLKVTILLAPLHKKLHFLPNWLQRERLFHLVLRKAHNYLSFVICEMKGLCLAQRQALLWMHCRSFFIVLLKIFISNLSPFPRPDYQSSTSNQTRI